jgi:hypothetical protein
VVCVNMIPVQAWGTKENHSNSVSTWSRNPYNFNVLWAVKNDAAVSRNLYSSYDFIPVTNKSLELNM